ILAGVELLVLTSDLEGIPGVAIESVMAGSPVVSVPVGGVAEVVDHGVTGVLLPGVDLDRMADEVVTLLADRRRLAAMSVAGRGQIQRFSASGTATLFSDSLVALLARRASGSTGRTRRR
ncbi:MAG: glycosyltransferase, partial [Acidimicrobiia bacterium]|nr:glycosyltransferase [Acidimicrobiia bacterium]